MSFENLNHASEKLINELSGPDHSIEQCGVIIQVCLAGLADAQAAMLTAFEPFGEWRKPRPIHCDNAFEAAALVESTLSSLTSLLNNPTVFPLRTLPVRYRLLAVSHQAEEQTQTLMRSVIEFRSVCLENTRASRRLRRVVDSILEALTKAGDDIQSQGASLVNQIESFTYDNAGAGWVN